METATKSKENKARTSNDLQIGITVKNRKQGAEELNKVLADEVLLYIKTLKFHWNIEGEGFHAMHIFLEEQYMKLQKMVDMVAERVRKIGYFATGSMKAFLKDTALDENEEDGKITLPMLGELVSDHNSIIKNVRDLIDKFEEDLEDAGTADMLTELLRQHEQMSWMLRAHLK